MAAFHSLPLAPAGRESPGRGSAGHGRVQPVASHRPVGAQLPQQPAGLDAEARARHQGRRWLRAEERHPQPPQEHHVRAWRCSGAVGETRSGQMSVHRASDCSLLAALLGRGWCSPPWSCVTCREVGALGGQGGQGFSSPVTWAAIPARRGPAPLLLLLHTHPSPARQWCRQIWGWGEGLGTAMCCCCPEAAVLSSARGQGLCHCPQHPQMGHPKQQDRPPLGACAVAGRGLTLLLLPSQRAPDLGLG